MLNNLPNIVKPSFKWQRRYKMVIELGRRDGITGRIPERIITIEYPFTCAFDIVQNVGAQVPQASFQVYNLSEEVQAALFKDESDFSVYRRVSFYAGYQDNVPLISTSEATSIYSYREGGSTNYITEFNCNDISYFFKENMSSMTITPNTELKSLLELLLKDTPYLEVGYVSPDIPSLKRARTFVGQTLDLLNREYGGYDIFIDKGKLNIIKADEVIESDISLIAADTGLLGTPRRAQQYLECKMIFEPRLKIAQAIELVSESLKWFNNTYRVLGLRHNGIISPVECGQVVTTVTLALGKYQYEKLQQLGESYGKEQVSGQWIKPTKTGYITSPFGNRKNPNTGKQEFHPAIDIGVKSGTNVLAAQAGTARTWVDGKGGGQVITIDHGKINGKRVVSKYLHLKQWLVANGAKVAQGQVIALSGGAKGDTGAGTSTGPHLDFRIQEDGDYVNPSKYIGSY